MVERFRRCWPMYLIEAWGLGVFMISACVFATVLEHPLSPVRASIDSGTLRRALMGLAMGLTAILIIYSPWGKRSGAHINPAVTLAFYRLDKVQSPDVVFYILFQFVGGALGVWLSYVVLIDLLADPAVGFVVTRPGESGLWIAFAAEFIISAGLMAMVLVTSNHERLQSYTGAFAGLFVGIYILIEAPLSGMSMNPARSVGSAIVANVWTAMWIYFVAPIGGMLVAAEIYGRTRGPAQCAKLQHGGATGAACHFKNCGGASE